MKEIIIEKGEVVKVFVYEGGKCIKQFGFRLNRNLQPFADNPKQIPKGDFLYNSRDNIPVKVGEKK